MVFQRLDNILIEKFDDHILLFDLDSNLPFILNPVAFYIFLNTDGRRDSKEIAQKVSQEFDVKFEQALSDVEELNQEFLRKKIVTRIDREGSHYKTR